MTQSPPTRCPHASAMATCWILPPDVIARVAEEGGPEDREAALRTIAASTAFRTRRGMVTSLLRQADLSLSALGLLAEPTGVGNTVYDMQSGGAAQLPGRRARGEGDSPSDDKNVNEAYDGAKATQALFMSAFDRNSIDDNGMELVSSVHYGTDFDNAFWNGSQMVYGDGSGRLFIKGGMTEISIIGHEMAHGITQFTAGLVYRTQSGALNESYSDVLGSLVKQHSLGQSADEADWLIGAGIVGPALRGEALRSMKQPGTAFEMDRQPGHMDDYVDLPDDNDPRNDNGGVHINSGIPNRAFYLAATAIGGKAWEKAGTIWYTTLTEKLDRTSQFVPAAEATVQVAAELFGSGGSEEAAVRRAWEDVGVL
jgi:Zn-dependent metalloprotease